LYNTESQYARQSKPVIAIKTLLITLPYNAEEPSGSSITNWQI